MSNMVTLAEAQQILTNLGYSVLPIPEHMPKPSYWWMAEPSSVYYDDISERDLLMLAETRRDNIQCDFCGEPAESHCPDCGTWTCWEDRRDYSPDFDQHWCSPCIGEKNQETLKILRQKS